jgi:hypothetical protein
MPLTLALPSEQGGKDEWIFAGNKLLVRVWIKGCATPKRTVKVQTAKVVRPKGA